MKTKKFFEKTSYTFFACFSVFLFLLFLFSTVGQETNQTEENQTTILETGNETGNATETTFFNETSASEEQTNATETEQNATETNATNTTLNQTQNNTNLTTSLVCSEVQCDEGCSVCSDGSCVAPEINCREELTIEKITPTTVAKGQQQLNILVRNTGTVALYEIEAEVSGYGVTTEEKISIEELPAGEKDYTFTKIDIQDAGIIDVVVKVMSNKTVMTQEIVQITVQEEVVEQNETTEETLNTTEATALLETEKAVYEEMEKAYFEKEKEGYLVYGIDEDLKEIKEYLRKAQVAIIEQNKEDFDKNLVLAKTDLEELKETLETAEKEKKTIGQLLSENLAVIGSLFGVIISGVTVWSLTKVHLKKANIVNIIKGKQILQVDKETKVENIVEKQDDEKTKDL